MDNDDQYDYPDEDDYSYDEDDDPNNTLNPDNSSHNNANNGASSIGSSKSSTNENPSHGRKHGRNGNGNRRNRVFIDPISEVPVLEHYFSIETYPDHYLIEKICENLNKGEYRYKFPKLESRNIQLWFKNHRAKLKRLKTTPTSTSTSTTTTTTPTGTATANQA